MAGSILCLFLVLSWVGWSVILAFPGHTRLLLQFGVPLGFVLGCFVGLSVSGFGFFKRINGRDVALDWVVWIVFNYFCLEVYHYCFWVFQWMGCFYGVSMSLWLGDEAVWVFQLTWGFNRPAVLGISVDWVHSRGCIWAFQMDRFFIFNFNRLRCLGCLGGIQWTELGLGGFKSVLSGLYG